MKRALVFAAALMAVTAVGCGEDQIAPTSPLLAFTGQFGGTWSGTLVVSPQGISGGECVGDDLRAQAAAAPLFDQGTLNVSQSALDVSAVVRSATTGLSCQYDGNAALASFALSAAACDTSEQFFQCSNGNSRVLRVIGSTMTAGQNGGTLSGVVTSTYNVSSINSQNERVPVADLTIQQQFTAVRR